MGLPSIVRAFGFGIMGLALFMMLPYIFALATGSPGPGDFLFGAVFCLVAGGGILAATGDKRPATDFRGGLLLALVWWTLAPIFAAVPMILHRVPVLDAWFLAVSALTTTGAWLSFDQLILSPAVHLWLALLQWIGGLVSIAIAASIIVRPAFFGVETLQLPFARGEQASYLRSFRNALKAFWAFYLGFTVLCFATLIFIGVGEFDASILALSAISSGGMTGTQASLDAYTIPALPIALMPFMVLSGVNFIFISFVVRGIWSAARNDETFVWFSMILIVGLLFWLLEGAGDVDQIPLQLFNALSLLSTNGILLGEAPPVAVAVVAALVGGATVSTAGGIKVLRWMIVIRRAREEIRQLVSPNIIQGKVSIADEFGVWIHFLVFTFALAVLTLLLSFDGHGFTIVVGAAAAALSNTGPLLAVAGGGVADYEMFGQASRALLIFVMILGRLEIVAAMALLNRAFWRS